MAQEPIGPAITISVQQLDRMRQRLQDYANRLRKPKGLAAGIAAMVETQVKHRIHDEKKAPDGRAWEPWADATKAQRKANHSLLEFQGRLRDSITGKALNGTTVVVGSDMVYANVHQYGHKFPNGIEVPARPFLGLSTDNENDIIDLIIDWCDPAQPTP